MRRLILLPLAAALVGLAAPSVAAPCKDAKGKFVKCPDKKPVRCKAPNGKFAKCGSPGAKPA
jgi:hypothetical protein